MCEPHSGRLVSAFTFGGIRRETTIQAKDFLEQLPRLSIQPNTMNEKFCQETCKLSAIDKLHNDHDVLRLFQVLRLGSAVQWFPAAQPWML